jgi:peptidyl-tRNA hydrolase, PTH1 family
VKLVVGLGNPGAEYQHSPHNMGFAVVDRLAERHDASLDRERGKALYARLDLPGETVWLLKPQTYMNLSGAAVREWFRKQGAGPEDLIVVADELDLPWGVIHLRQRGGSAGHHGLESIMDAIGTREFIRVRIGVAPEETVEDPVGYLLRPMRRQQREQMDKIVDRAADATEMILKDGIAKAMNRFNRREAAGGAPDSAAQ